MILRRQVCMPLFHCLLSGIMLADCAWAQPELLTVQWVNGPLLFSKSAGIRENKIELGPADAEIEPHEGNIFCHVRIRFVELDDNERTDLVSATYLEDAKGEKHEAIAVLHQNAWRPIGFLSNTFRIIRVPKVAEILVELPRSSPSAYTLVLNEHRFSNLEKIAGPFPVVPAASLPQSMWCIFEGLKLRRFPSPSADGDTPLHAGDQVEKIREQNNCYYVKAKDAEGWGHRSAFVDSRSLANQVQLHNPKPNALFVATTFTGPSNFNLEIWHGHIQLPSNKLESTPILIPGNCIFVTKPTANDFDGHYTVFGHAVQSTQLDELLVFNNEHKLVPLVKKASSLQKSVVILSVVMGIALMALLFVLRRLRTIRNGPSDATSTAG